MKTVAIVGCGSLGSKVAVSLARSGVSNFVLVDDDVMLPENIVRNELDWSAIGDQKVDALARRIALVSPTAQCASLRHQLGGQESSQGLAIVLSRLGKCDLVVDATASARVFNLLGAVVDRTEKPLVWAEVFPGGIGGLVARSRPGLDPSPQTARARVAAWCEDKGIPAPQAVAPYESVSGDVIHVADDADVTVIAAHTARLVIDLLVEPTESVFPHSAYFIGLEAGWIFAEPFHTFPVDLGSAEIREAEPPDPGALGTLQRLIKDFCDRPRPA
nr:ThiF family adenylyltransferase [Paraburkholderia sp. BL25I1N1]